MSYTMLIIQGGQLLIRVVASSAARRQGYQTQWVEMANYRWTALKKMISSLISSDAHELTEHRRVCISIGSFVSERFSVESNRENVSFWQKLSVLREINGKPRERIIVTVNEDLRKALNHSSRAWCQHFSVWHWVEMDYCHFSPRRAGCAPNNLFDEKAATWGGREMFQSVL